jgi:hypothetical protein
MIIIGNVFLNLFMAIVVDKFTENAQSEDSPVEKHDFVEFLDVWKIYDPEGSGYIAINDFDDFLHSLAQTDSGFFKLNKSSISDTLIREQLYLRLELPTHKNYTKYMFYDVLINLCRAACQTSFLMPQLKANLRVVNATSKFSGKNVSKGTVRMRATCMVLDDNTLDFNKLMADLRLEGGKYSSSQLVTTMNEEGERIG